MRASPSPRPGAEVPVGLAGRRGDPERSGSFEPPPELGELLGEKILLVVQDDRVFREVEEEELVRTIELLSGEDDEVQEVEVRACPGPLPSSYRRAGIKDPSHGLQPLGIPFRN